MSGASEKRGALKGVVWDLDNTLWDGVLLEDRQVQLRPWVADTIRTLDGRGIIQSIASRNHFPDARARLEEAGLWDYFLCPQIHWGSKVESLRTVASTLNLGLDTLALVDDDPFEREAVAFSLPQVTTLDPALGASLSELPALQPRFITDDSRLRRAMYRQDILRNESERTFEGTKEEFLATLGMKLKIFPAVREDLRRAEELTVRTNQLNSTGIPYSYEQLDVYRTSSSHRLWMANLEDRFGDFGRIGLALIECGPTAWTIRLLLMSCRVMSRGVGAVMLNHIVGAAQRAGVSLRADFIPNERNRQMAVTYAFAGFQKVETNEAVQTLAIAPPAARPVPPYVELIDSTT